MSACLDKTDSLTGYKRQLDSLSGHERQDKNDSLTGYECHLDSLSGYEDIR